MKHMTEAKLALHERDTVIVSLAKSGTSFADIARMHNLTRERVRQIAVKAGIRHRKVIDPKELLALYHAGTCIIDIANHFRVSIPTISLRLRHAGIKRKFAIEYAKVHGAKIKTMRKRGYSIPAIATAINIKHPHALVTKAGVAQYLRSENIAPLPLGSHKRKLTDDDVDQLYADHASGTSKAELAERYGVCLETVRKILRKEFDYTNRR